MTSVRAVYGTAEVELESDISTHSGGPIYRPSDAVNALLQVLRALDGDWSNRAVEGIREGLSNAGCEL